ncbi:MAG: hypothetical protein CUN50_00445 [Candidatus Thermofonsia Clade 1 bacterium]|uniref:MBG domain-containing protein n=1 Tax=Candidatus Thermofonsia Clade 1 bacterium TaxID=2364210 RepID=A0A2M8Q0T3_9CHLR|nr:MAG: hypothetical protein CUN50_00445 [Candidatus Thermofonsia Clade 1 bacterium]
MKRLLALLITFAVLLTGFALTPTPTSAQGCTVTFGFTYPNPFNISLTANVQLRTEPPPGGTVLASGTVIIPAGPGTFTLSTTLTIASPYTGPVYGRVFGSFTFGAFTFTNDSLAGPFSTDCGGISTFENCAVTFSFTYTKPPGNPASSGTAQVRTAPGGGGELLGTGTVSFAATVTTPVTFNQSVTVAVKPYGGPVWARVIGVGSDSDIGPLKVFCGQQLGCFDLRGAGQGLLTRPTPLYWAPRPDAASTVVLDTQPDAKTYWVLGVDATRRFYKIIIACNTYWVPVDVLVPNPDNVWRGAPLPTNVVD